MVGRESVLMFEHLKQHKKILVTGPHRSGTTFAATAIQRDLKDTHGLVKEELCHFQQGGVEHWLSTPNPCVIQAPFVADVCHQYPQAFIVYMLRNPEDIEKSQWKMTMKNGEKVFWPKFEMVVRGDYHTDDYSRTIAEIKYDNWQEQKQRLPNYLELEYESLCEHPLWIAPEHRKLFHGRQVYAVD
jgi:hypothetical protein